MKIQGLEITLIHFYLLMFYIMQKAFTYTLHSLTASMLFLTVEILMYLLKNYWKSLASKCVFPCKFRLTITLSQLGKRQPFDKGDVFSE